MTKAQARAAAKAKISKMPDAEKEWACGAIADAVSSLEEFRSAYNVFVFLGAENEPDTEEIVGLALAMEKNVSVPRVRGEEMDAVLITPYTNFKRNNWNILEPVGGRVTDLCDVALIPLVAYDGLDRVGRGKGYYDKFLRSKDCVKIGLAFDCQSVEELETDSFDVQLDAIVTEKRVLRKKDARKKDAMRDNPFFGGGAQ